MENAYAVLAINRLVAIAVSLLLVVWLAATAAFGQVAGRAEPVTGPGVTTIGGIGANARINVRRGPTILFPVVGTLGFGTRVEKGVCIGGGSARWCQVETMDGKVSGYVSGQFLVEGSAPPPPDDLEGGPDYWAVRGLAANDRLGVRQDPKAGSPVLATLRENEIVRNLGCRLIANTRWCRVRSTTGIDVTGWVTGRYLREAAAPPPVHPPIGGGGPNYYVVSGLSAGDVLNVRTRASTQGTVIARLVQGAKVRNLGCQQSGQTQWCQITTTGSVEVTGWVNGRYLRER